MQINAQTIHLQCHAASTGGMDYEAIDRVASCADCRVHSGKHGAGQCRGVLPVRQLSSRVCREARCRASAAAGCARRNSYTWSRIPGHSHESWRPGQSRWKTLILLGRWTAPAIEAWKTGHRFDGVV